MQHLSLAHVISELVGWYSKHLIHGFNLQTHYSTIPLLESSSTLGYPGLWIQLNLYHLGTCQNAIIEEHKLFKHFYNDGNCVN